MSATMLMRALERWNLFCCARLLCKRYDHTARIKTVAAMTLVEVLAVVVILGLLAAVLVVGLSGRIGQSRVEIARTQVSQVMQALENFNLVNHRLPSPQEGLDVLSVSPQASYFMDKGKLTDPWGRPFTYLVPGPNGHPYEIATYGADGQPGGSGENIDLSSLDLRKQ